MNTVDLLSQLSLEDLANVQVTSVSRKEESLSRVAAAVHVIDQDEIRRSGVNSIADALRMTPGLSVGRANSREWAITSRGFNGTFANKLLVLMDGRSIYTPLFSGVFWEETDTVLEDIDRIEVIRGPGATMWGANAVNGVVNIITKSAEQTQGVLLSGGGGMEERGFGTLRYGGRLGTNAYYRVYGKYLDRDDFSLEGGGRSEDSWNVAQGGFRVDWEATTQSRLTLQGDFYRGDLGGKVLVHSLDPPGMVPLAFRSDVEGQNVLGRWTRSVSDDSEISLQAYYDRTDRAFGIGGELRDTVDLDAQHRFRIGDYQEVVWGGGYRLSADEITESDHFKMVHPSETLSLVSAFVQDEFSLVNDRMKVALGMKVEHNDFTGFEFQPSIRASWEIDQRSMVWAAVSRAVRTPSRNERDASFYVEAPGSISALGFPTLVSASGDPDFDSERMIAYELGWRFRPHARLSLDLATFFNDYDRLWTVQVGAAELRLEPSPYLLVPVGVNNSGQGETYGSELSASWQALSAWRLTAGYTLLKVQLHSPEAFRSVNEGAEGVNPVHQVFLASDIDFGDRVEWGVGARYIDNLPSAEIGDYFELNSRLAWDLNEHCELAIIGRHLLDPRHREFAPLVMGLRNVEVERAIFAKVTLRW
ncbi:MAG: TonB-dependent receptor [Verrucomicrobia bacterium]|nr:TonB-dependent receptor [Verrucomicrobiota bacterium]